MRMFCYWIKNVSASIEHKQFLEFMHILVVSIQHFKQYHKLNIRIGGWKHIAKEGLKNGGYKFGHDL